MRSRQAQVPISATIRKLRFRMLDVRRLRVLLELAEQGTIAATARSLGYSPPAVSQQLAALEREAGVALLEPEGRGRRLTDAGRELVHHAAAVLRELEAAEAALARTRTDVVGELRCAAFPSAFEHVLVPALAQLAAAHPGLRPVARELEPDEALPALRRRELDLVVGQHYAFRPQPDDPALERVALFEEPVRLAAPVGRFPAGPVAMGDLAEEGWVIGRTGTWCESVVLHTARAAGFEPRAAHRAQDFAVVQALVAHGMALALLPALAGPPRTGVALHELTGPPVARAIYAAVRAGSTERPAIRAALDALQR